jgi:hypothetical protein
MEDIHVHEEETRRRVGGFFSSETKRGLSESVGHGIQDKRFEGRLDHHISGTERGAKMKPGHNILKTILERSSNLRKNVLL